MKIRQESNHFISIFSFLVFVKSICFFSNLTHYHMKTLDIADFHNGEGRYAILILYSHQMSDFQTLFIGFLNILEFYIISCFNHPSLFDSLTNCALLVQQTFILLFFRQSNEQQGQYLSFTIVDWFISLISNYN